jgi:hypothetical protein
MTLWSLSPALQGFYMSGSVIQNKFDMPTVVAHFLGQSWPCQERGQKWDQSRKDLRQGPSGKLKRLGSAVTLLFSLISLSWETTAIWCRPVVVEVVVQLGPTSQLVKSATFTPPSTLGRFSRQPTECTFVLYSSNTSRQTILFADQKKKPAWNWGGKTPRNAWARTSYGAGSTQCKPFCTHHPYDAHHVRPSQLY